MVPKALGPKRLLCAGHRLQLLDLPRPEKRETLSAINQVQFQSRLRRHSTFCFSAALIAEQIMDVLVERLHAAGPAITNILTASGTAGAAVGILHRGQVAQAVGYGFRDVARQLPMDQESIVSLFSLTKSMTASAIGSLLSDEDLTWDTTFCSLLPDFRHHSPTVQRETTLRDLLSHRVGFAQYNALFMQDHGRLYLPKDQTLATASALPLTAGFREKFQYNNWNYGLAALVTQPLSGLSLGAYLVKHFFEPLGMMGTSVVRPLDGDNVSEAYMALADGTPALTDRPSVGDDQIMFGAMGVNSCVKDLLIWYGQMMRAGTDQLDKGTTSTDGSPFQRIPDIWNGQMPLPQVSLRENSHGLGFFRTQLPSVMASGTMNSGKLPTPPVVARGSPSRIALYHGGNSAASQNWAVLLPETQSAVVVLTNTMANCDAANLIASLLLEALLDSPEKRDYEELARVASQRGVQQWHELHDSMAKQQTNGTISKPLDFYTGKYWNHLGNWYMEIFLEDGGLALAFQGDRANSHRLHHYNYDVFTWLLTQDENVASGRFPYTSKGQWLLSFQGKGGTIEGLRWNQNGIKEGELFHKGEFCNSVASAE